MHDLSLITTIAAAFTAAWIVGLLSQRIGLSPIVGYLVAGVLIGPHTPGFVGDVHVAAQLAEIGVILLMFGVGLHFHLQDLIAVRGVAIPGAVGQSVVATLLAVVIFGALNMSVQTAAVLGMAMAVASTVVLMRVLMDADVLNSPQGHVAVGWLIVEDVFTVVLLVLIPVLGRDSLAAHDAASASGTRLWASLGIAMLKLAALLAIVFLAGSRLVPRMLMHVARLRSRELFTLTILVFSIAIAAASYRFFGASMALGAFLAGMMVAQSPVSHQAAAEALPLRDAFAVLFFVSVGMLFDPGFLLQEPVMVAAALAIILIAKPVTALIIVAILGYSGRTALTVALGLAQIGEFSFILSDLARRHGLMSDAGHNVLVAAAIISISLNPLLFRMLPRLEAWLRRHSRVWKLLNGRAEKRAASTNAGVADRVARGPAAAGDRRAIVVGYGTVGRSVDHLLRDAGMTTVVVDFSMDTVSSLNASGQTAVYGDATHESILLQAGVRHASHVVFTLPHSPDRATIVANARRLNPRARILVRARDVHEREELEHAGASATVFDEAEASVALARVVLADAGVHREAAERKIRDLRLHLIVENIAGPMRDEYPRAANVSLAGALVRGGIVLDLVATARDGAIRELAHAIPRGNLPGGSDAGAVAALAIAREEDMSTDLGNGVALPHARCANLSEPLAVFGRSRNGVVFSPDTQDRAHLILLLVTPLEIPDVQLALLSQAAHALGDSASRTSLHDAESPADVMAALARNEKST